MLYLKLFLSFFKLGAFGFGGGYAMVALLESEIATNYPDIGSGELVDILAISEMTPGPIAINSATFFGYRVGGLLGALVATLSVVLPSLIIMSILIYIINRYKGSEVVDSFIVGVRPIVLGLIASGAYAIGRNGFRDLASVLIGLSAFYLVTFKKFNPIYAIILAGMAGAILY